MVDARLQHGEEWITSDDGCQKFNKWRLISRDGLDLATFSAQECVKIAASSLIGRFEFEKTMLM
jgi:hypothetical protein